MQSPDSTVYISQSSVDSINAVQTISSETQAVLNELEKPLSPESDSESLKEPLSPPKLVAGQLAVCSACGYLSEDFNRCMRCKRKFVGPIKTMQAPPPGTKKVDHQMVLVESKKAVPQKNLGMFSLKLM